jgi:selenocysteine-specific elongation factor
MRVIGTAGHVDHGKSTLVEALTGIDPDRLQEEKEREMTIDLGFAWLTLPSGEQVGIVDVPGHKDFIKNMLAGVGGIDAALFVVAADEGVMPQTREHLAIVDLLQVRGGVVAITKKDLVEDEEWLELVIAEIAEELEDTVLAEAPVVPVSARTGEGLHALLEELDQYLQTTPARRDLGRPRLPIDRVFTIAGFGTVVTGTLSDGHLTVGQEVEVMPQGLKARIRGLQTHKEKIETAMPGSRVAINLGGVSTDQLNRGDVVTLPGALRATKLIDVRLQYLADAPKPLKHNAALEFFSGAAEIQAHVRLLDQEVLRPGETGWALLRLVSPAVLVKNDRFIVRQPSPGATIGGGVVVNVHPRRRYRRFRPEVIARLETMAHGDPKEILLQALESQQPCEAKELVKRCGLSAEEAAKALNALLSERQVIVLSSKGPAATIQQPATSSQYLISRSGWQSLTKDLSTVLGGYHQQYPLRRGMSREELKSRSRLASRLFNEVVGLAAREGKLIEEETTIRLPQHEVKFGPAEQRKVDALLAEFRRNPYTTPSVTDCEAQIGTEVLNSLIEQGRLSKVSEDVIFLTETYEEMVDRIVARIEREGNITVAQVRDMFGASRKYALGLMEHLDERRVTKRVGDERVLR